MRRNNPRNAVVAGNSGLRHRLVRRGLPYGPPFDPANPDDGIERGLIGLFIAASLKDQFEFVMRDWVNGDSFAPGLRGTRDPILGNLGGRNGHVHHSATRRPVDRRFRSAAVGHDAWRLVRVSAKPQCPAVHRATPACAFLVVAGFSRPVPVGSLMLERYDPGVFASGLRVITWHAHRDTRIEAPNGACERSGFAITCRRVRSLSSRSPILVLIATITWSMSQSPLP